MAADSQIRATQSTLANASDRAMGQITETEIPGNEYDLGTKLSLYATITEKPPMSSMSRTVPSLKCSSKRKPSPDQPLPDKTMPDPSDIPKSLIWEFDHLLAQATAEQQKNQLFYDETEHALGQIARRFYPLIANWQPENLRRLADRISRYAATHSAANSPTCSSVERRIRGER